MMMMMIADRKIAGLKMEMTVECQIQMKQTALVDAMDPVLGLEMGRLPMANRCHHHASCTCARRLLAVCRRRLIKDLLNWTLVDFLEQSQTRS